MKCHQRSGRRQFLKTTAKTLADAGYALGHRGKWHLGDKGSFGCYESLLYAGKRGEYHALLADKLPASRFKADKEPGRYLGRPVRKTDAIRKGWKAFQELPRNGVKYIATIGQTVHTRFPRNPRTVPDPWKQPAAAHRGQNNPMARLCVLPTGGQTAHDTHSAMEVRLRTETANASPLRPEK